jgi:spore coat polysaccharide biosynthesis protein SpsF
MTKIIAIVQARLESTRLPGKTMMDIMGRPMLWHVINRLKQSRRLTDIVIATTTNEKDKAIVRLARENSVKSYAGNEEDVLDRYYQAAIKFKTDVIVRLTADCPLIDPEIVDKVIEYFLSGNSDYVSNTVKPSYPDGLDTEVFSFGSLQRAWEEAKLKSEREHVTAYLWKHPELFKIGNVKNDIDLSRFRWTVDIDEDLQFVREIYQRLYIEDRIFYMEDVLKLLKQHPELLAINSSSTRNQGYAKSLSEDKMVK